MEDEYSLYPNKQARSAGLGEVVALGQGSPISLNALAEAVYRSPHHECPIRSVPKSPEKHGDDQIPMSAELSMPAPAQRDV
jgi:hypothetical protein